MGRVDYRTCWRRSAGQQQPTIWVRLRCFLDVEHLLDLFRVQNRSQRASDHAGGFHLNKRCWNRSLVILKSHGRSTSQSQRRILRPDQGRDEVIRISPAAKWEKRLAGKTFERIFIKHGYPKTGDQERIVERPWRGFERQTIVHPHFGATPTVVLAIRVN